MIPTLRLPERSSVLVRLSDLRDMIGDEPVPEPGATVTMTLTDAVGSPVSGASSLSMSPATPGANDYVGTLPDSLVVVPGAAYTLTVTASAGAGKVRRFKAAVVFF